MRRTNLRIEFPREAIGNSVLLIGLCCQALKKAGQGYLWKEFFAEAKEATEFGELLEIVQDWFEVA